MMLEQAAWFIEWTPKAVRATNLASGSSIDARSLGDLKGQISGKSVVGISRTSSYLKAVRLPDAKAADLSAIVTIHAAQILPQAQGQLAFGFHATSDVNSEGRLVILAAVPTSLLEKLYAELEAISVVPLGVVPLAAGSTFVAREYGLDNAVVVESGIDGTSIDIVRNGEPIYTKVASGKDLIAEIERSVAAVGMQMPQIVGTTAGGLGQVHDSLPGTSLLLQHLGAVEPYRMELPAVVAKRERALVGNRMRFAILMAVAAIGVGLLIYDQRSEMQAAVDRERASVTNSLRKWSKQRDALLLRQTKSALLSSELRRAFQPAQPLSDVVLSLGNNVPSGLWLTGISVERGKPALLRGVATSHDSVGEFLQTLNGDPRFRDAKLAFANQSTIETTNVVQFSLSSHVVGNLPTVKTKQERSKK